jgi:hypothetical protein
VARQAIRNEGEKAERIVLELVAGSRKSDSAKKGDAIVALDGADHYVEIKFVTSNTVNQVRAIKFIPLAIYSPQEEKCWAVLPAYEVVRLVFHKDRGQHTELALESANMTLTGISQSFRCNDAELNSVVQNAIRSARKYSRLETTLVDFLACIRGIKGIYAQRIELALEEGDSA